ncbi:MAG: hypothetical protein JNL58_04815 [Planctomyces sp.]|nr:hypothetical protein [Planctomyces sp.]
MASFPPPLKSRASGSWVLNITLWPVMFWFATGSAGVSGFGQTANAEELQIPLSVPASVSGDNRERPVVGLVIRSKLLEKVVAEERRETKPIRKIILGSQVTGTQSTITRVTGKVLTDSQRLRLELRNIGTVSSTTEGLNPQARVESTGSHSFDVIKPVYFDGAEWLTQRCYGTVRAQQTPVLVRSSASGAPLIGPAADQIAWQEVIRRGPQIDQAVAEDLANDVLPEIDVQTDTELTTLNEQWRLLRRTVRSSFPDVELRWQVRSSEELIVLVGIAQDTSGAEVNAGALAESLLSGTPTLRDGEDVAVYFSDKAAGYLVNRIAPRGKISDSVIDEVLAEFENAESADTPGQAGMIASLLAVKERFETTTESPAAVYSLELAEQSPFEFQFESGRIRMITTMQVHPRFGLPSGWFRTLSEYQGATIDESMWTVRNTAVRTEAQDAFTALKIPVDELSAQGEVSSAEPPQEDSSTAASPLPAVSPWQTLIETTTKSLLSRIPEPRIPRTLELPGLNDKLPAARIHRIQCEDGWMRLSLTF